jgi:hypothetical protein
MDFESSFQRITSPKPTVRVMGDGFEGQCAGNMYPTSLKHEAFSTGRRVPHNAEGSLTVGQSFKFAVPFDLCQKGLRQGRSEKPRPTPEKSPQMRTDTWNAHALSWRNIATISEKQRMFLSCPDWLAVEPVSRQPVSVWNSLEQGKIQGISEMTGHRAAVQSAGRAIPHQFIRAHGLAPFFQNRELTGN